MIALINGASHAGKTATKMDIPLDFVLSCESRAFLHNTRRSLLYSALEIPNEKYIISFVFLL